MLDFLKFDQNDSKKRQALAQLLNWRTEFSLRYSATDFTQQAQENLVKALENNTTVTELSLELQLQFDKNRIKPLMPDFALPLAKNMAKVLRANSTITNLSLSHNEIGYKAMLEIIEGLKENKSLTQLDLSANLLQDGAINKLAEVLEDNTTLTHLGLFANDITKAGLKRILELVTKNSSLIYVSLEGNAEEDSEIIKKIQTQLDWNKANLQKEHHRLLTEALDTSEGGPLPTDLVGMILEYDVGVRKSSSDTIIKLPEPPEPPQKKTKPPQRRQHTPEAREANRHAQTPPVVSTEEPKKPQSFLSKVLSFFKTIGEQLRDFFTKIISRLGRGEKAKAHAPGEKDDKIRDKAKSSPQKTAQNYNESIRNLSDSSLKEETAKALAEEQLKNKNAP